MKRLLSYYLFFVYMFPLFAMYEKAGKTLQSINNVLKQHVTVIPQEITQQLENIIIKNSPIGLAAPHIKQLSQADPTWKRWLSDKTMCNNILKFVYEKDQYKTPLEIAAVFFGTPGTIEWAKDYLQENPMAKINVSKMLVDTGLWAESDKCAWQTQTTDVAETILKITNNSNVIIGGRTALLNASKTGNLQLIRLLLSYNASPNPANTENSTTALHEATRGGHFEAVKMLLEAGANVEQKDGNNKTAYDVALTIGKYSEGQKIIAVLLKITEKKQEQRSFNK